MNIKTLLTIVALTIGVNSNAQTTIAGVTLAAEFSAGGNTLTLNGAGTRERFTVKLYVAGLYVSSNSSDAQKIIDADEAMSVQLNIVSNLITSAEMVSSTQAGFEKSTNGRQEELRDDIDDLTSAFNTEIKSGDVFDIVYLPGKGVDVYKNGTRTTTVGDLRFKKALWGIWLGDDPVSQSLKEAKLGLKP